MASRPSPRYLTVDLLLPTAHCAGCRRAVVDELSRVDGIVDVVVDAGGTTCITHDSAVVAAADIIRRLSDAGYPPTPAGPGRAVNSLRTAHGPDSDPTPGGRP